MVKLNIDLPKSMFRIAQNDGTREKPYDLCLSCPFFGESCDGPNVLAMEYPRWVEWANTRARQLGLTRADIAERSNLPKGTVDSALSGRNKDIRSATMRDITEVLIGGCWGQYPCHLAAMLMRGELEDTAQEDESTLPLRETERRLQAVEAERDDLLRKLADSDNRTQAQLDKFEAEAQKKIEWLKGNIAEQRKVKVIYGAILVALVAFMVALFTADLMMPETGWIRF